MIGHYRILLLTALVILTTSLQVAGQDNPPAPEDPTIKAPAAAPSAKPLSQGKGEVAPAPIVPGADEPPAVKLAVQTLIDSKPTTAREVLRAAALLLDFNRPDLAHEYLQKLAATQLGDEALVEAAEQVSPGMLIRVAGAAALQPEGKQVVDAVLAAAAQRAGEPQQLKAAVDELGEPSTAVQRHALVKLKAADVDAVPALLAALADPQREATHRLARFALVQLGEAAVDPLAAAMRSDDVPFKLQLIDVLAQIGSPRAVIYLLAPAIQQNGSPELRTAAKHAIETIYPGRTVTVEDAKELLIAEIQRDLPRNRRLPTDADDQADLWRWDAASHTLVRERMPVDNALTTMSLRLASDLIDIAPNDPRARKLYLVCQLASAGDLAAGNETAAPETNAEIDRVGKLSPVELADALDFALSTGQLHAAAAAAGHLGATGDLKLLEAHGARVSPLVESLTMGDRRVRFAAAEAIMRLPLKSGFPGSSDLVKTLAQFADAPGTKRALIAHPNFEMAGQMAAQLSALGYEVDFATNGHQAYLQALTSGDYELLLLSSRIDHVPVWVLLQELRREPRTAWLPIALVGETGDLARMQSDINQFGRVTAIPDVDAAWLASGLGDDMTLAFERPFTSAGMKFWVDQLIPSASGHVETAETRQQQAVAALGWLKQLNDISAKDFNIRPYEAVFVRALPSETTGAAAAELLARLGTGSSQKALVNFANNSLGALSLREAAAAAFAQSVKRYGIQLRRAEILHQYHRYNESAAEDEPTQKLLGQILDAMEAPTRKR